jgi:Putative MetA-pathway of phenol degradation
MSAQEGGIELFAGETIYRSGRRVSITEIYTSDELHTGSREAGSRSLDQWTEKRTVLGFDYGLRPDLQVSILVPYVHRELRVAGARTKGDGLGDTVLLVKKRVYKRDWRQGSFNVALVVGGELPTGATGEMTRGVRNGPSAQPGNGAWNPFFALAANVDSGLARYDALLFYKVNTEGAQRVEEGDFFVASVNAAYRFINMEYPGPALGAGVGLSFQHRGRTEVAGASDANSGSDVLFFRAGISANPRPNLDLAFGLDLPIVEHYNGTQLGREIQATLTFAIRF